MDMTRLFLSAAAAVVLTVPLLSVLRRNGILGRKNERIIAEARTAGRVATAQLVNAVWSRGEPGAKTAYDRAELWRGTYRYEVDGKQYTFRTQGEDRPPETLELFYPAGRPGRATCEGREDHSGLNIFAALLPVLVWAFFYNFVFK